MVSGLSLLVAIGMVWRIRAALVKIRVFAWLIEVPALTVALSLSLALAEAVALVEAPG